MNDCFYSMVGCNGICQACSEYLSINEDAGFRKYDEYEAKVEKVLNPIRKQYLSELKLPH